jgi:predicted nucleic acid-binding protein
VRQAADSSIALAAILADYEGHEQAEDALKACTRTIAHAAIETYSVLTRLPPPHRLDGPSAAAIIAARLPPTYATLDATACASATPRLAEAGINGGASYDGLIALTALEHDLELVSRDRRAARTYRALGVRFTLLDGSLAP